MLPDKPTLLFSHVLRASVCVASLFIILAGLHAASRVLAPLCVALFLSCIVLAPYYWMRRHGSSRNRGIFFTVGGVVLAGGLLFVLSIRWARILSDRGPVLWVRLIETADLVVARFGELGILIEGHSLIDSVNMQMISSVGGSVFRITLAIASVILLTGFVLADLVALPDKLHGILRDRPRLATMLAGTAERLLTYFRIKTGTSIVTGVLVGITCSLVGLEMPILWGFLAFVLNYVTTIGSLIAAVFPLLLAIATLDGSTVLLLGFAYLVINIVIGGVIEPKLLGSSMNLSPLVILLSLALWGWILGPIGLLLAVPLTTLLKIVLEETESLRSLALVLGSRRYARHARRSLEQES